ncbi:MAG: hypothetical protein RLN62_05545 [Rickettsiales bacterium]
MPTTIYVRPDGDHHVFFDSIECFDPTLMRGDGDMRFIDLLDEKGDPEYRVFYQTGSFEPFNIYRFVSGVMGFDIPLGCSNRGPAEKVGTLIYQGEFGDMEDVMEATMRTDRHFPFRLDTRWPDEVKEREVEEEKENDDFIGGAEGGGYGGDPLDGPSIEDVLEENLMPSAAWPAIPGNLEALFGYSQ